MPVALPYDVRLRLLLYGLRTDGRTWYGTVGYPGRYRTRRIQAVGYKLKDLLVLQNCAELITLLLYEYAVRITITLQYEYSTRIAIR